MKNKLYRPFLATAICLLTLTACQKKTPKVYTETDINIIPKIEKVKINPGVFEFNENTTFVVSNDEQKNAATLLQDKFKLAANWDLAITDASEKSNIITFKEDKNLAEETYKLTVTDAQITIEASGYSGYLYATQSLRQLLPTAIGGLWATGYGVWAIRAMGYAPLPLAASSCYELLPAATNSYRRATGYGLRAMGYGLRTTATGG